MRSVRLRVAAFNSMCRSFCIACGRSRAMQRHFVLANLVKLLNGFYTDSAERNRNARVERVRGAQKQPDSRPAAPSAEYLRSRGLGFASKVSAGAGPKARVRPLAADRQGPRGDNALRAARALGGAPSGPCEDLGAAHLLSQPTERGSALPRLRVPS